VDIPPVARNMSWSTLAIHSPHIGWCKISGRLPPSCFPASPVASGCRGNFRQRSICEIRSYGRYAIAPVPLSAVGALDHRLTGIAVIALEWVCGCLYPPSWWGLCRSSIFENPIHCSKSPLLKPPPHRLVIFRTCACCPFQEFILPTPMSRRLVVGVR